MKFIFEFLSFSVKIRWENNHLFHTIRKSVGTMYKINKAVRSFSRFAFDNLFITLVPKSTSIYPASYSYQLVWFFFFKSNVSRWNKFQKNSVSKVDRPRWYYFSFPVFFSFRILTSQKGVEYLPISGIGNEKMYISDRGYCVLQ